MFYHPFRKVTLRERFKLFFSSYNGWVAIAGIVCFIHTILYRVLWVNIQAPIDIFVHLGSVFDAISLSVIASAIFYFITVYLPRHHKRKVLQNNIIKWLQQLEYYGVNILEDFGGDISCTKEEFTKKTVGMKLMSCPHQRITIREQCPMNTWFDYFDNFFYWESVYMNQVIKYGDLIPPEIHIEFEKFNQFDNLKSAVYLYKENYDRDKIYQNVSGISGLIWLHAHSLIKLPEMYVLHMYD